MSDEELDRPEDVWAWLDKLADIALEAGVYLCVVATLVFILFILRILKP